MCKTTFIWFSGPSVENWWKKIIPKIIFPGVYIAVGQGATDIIIGIADSIGIGRYIGFPDMGNAYRYQLLVSADKKAHIGSLADIMK